MSWSVAAVLASRAHNSVGGDPGHDEAAGMVDQMVASQGVDQLALSVQMGPCDLDHLTIATRGGDGTGPTESVRVAVEQGRHDDDERVIGRVGAPGDAGDRVSVAADGLPD